MDPADVLNLYNQYSSGLAGYQDEENKTRINYQSALDTLRKRRRQDINTLAVGAADRGLTHSGANLKTNLDLNEGYNTAEADTGRNYADTLASLARRKLQSEADFNLQRSLF
jgi:hypothetical protein